VAPPIRKRANSTSARSFGRRGGQRLISICGFQKKRFRSFLFIFRVQQKKTTRFGEGQKLLQSFYGGQIFTEASQIIFDNLSPK
jgi:hypothetical protein